MLLYFAFVSVFLLMPIKDYKRQLSDEYTDSSNSVIDVDSYCSEKPCLVKCCKDGESLNSKGECFDTRQSMGGMNVRDFVLQQLMTNGRTKEVKAKSNQLKEDFVFVHTDKFVNSSISEHWDPEFYILEDGSLWIKNYNETKHHEVVSPLEFCLDYRVTPFKDTKVKTTFSFKLAENRETSKSTGAIAKSKIIALGLLIIIFVQSGFVFLLPKSRKIVTLVKTAFIVSLVLAYLLEMVQLLSPHTDFIDLSDCRLMSPAIYYFTLSNFFWVTILVYDVWRRIRNSPLLCDKPVRQESDRAKFLLYCVFGWAAPLFITILALEIDLQDFGKIVPIIEPPFESCFADERQTTIFLYIPITFLSITTCILIVLSLCGAMQSKQVLIKRARARARQNNINIDRTIQNLAVITDKCKLIRLRVGIALKVLFIIGLMVAVHQIPGVPLLIDVLVNIYSIVVAAAIVSLIFLEKSLLITPCQSAAVTGLLTEIQEYISRVSPVLNTLGLKTKDIDFERMDDSKEIADDNTTNIVDDNNMVEIQINK